MSIETGLRERKRQRTRAAIVRAAMELFYERGFDATTVVDIAGAVEISPRTFFAYFPVKEAVVFPTAQKQLDLLKQLLAERGREESALQVWGQWVLGLDVAQQEFRAEDRRRRELIRETPSLVAYERTQQWHLEVLLADAIADDMGVDRHALAPRLAAAAAASALDAINRHHDQAADRSSHAAPFDPAGMMAEAMVFLNGGLEALSLAATTGGRDGAEKPQQISGRA
ncbi:TetR family transcriptional regulator [Mycobacterium canetti]|uniref:TetR family transcriptional regulator n=1 Tax=Mycobacterium canetti TaxID=78331 RepID=UPI0002A5A6D7|nr:TetR family transcriptional regulator [Mycobacterium canetti]CCK59974.1 Putative transcriptional regulator, TetR family [Mycobacterium canettii CIPT 140070010]